MNKALHLHIQGPHHNHIGKILACCDNGISTRDICVHLARIHLHLKGSAIIGNFRITSTFACVPVRRQFETFIAEALRPFQRIHAQSIVKIARIENSTVSLTDISHFAAICSPFLVLIMADTRVRSRKVVARHVRATAYVRRSAFINVYKCTIYTSYTASGSPWQCPKGLVFSYPSRHSHR